jgi:hypothetical protein
VVFALYSDYVPCYIYWFVYVVEAMHLLDETHRIIPYDLFTALLDSVRKYFIGNFCICVHQVYWPITFFFDRSLPDFGKRVIILASQNKFDSIPSLCILWNSLTFFKGLVEHSNESIQTYFSFFEKFFITVPISLLIIDLFWLFVSSCFTFDRSYVQEIYQLILNFPVC